MLRHATPPLCTVFVHVHLPTLCIARIVQEREAELLQSKDIAEDVGKFVEGTYCMAVWMDGKEPVYTVQMYVILYICVYSCTCTDIHTHVQT